MDKAKVTLPAMDEDGYGPFAVRDWARSNGAWTSSDTYKINGVKRQRSGFGWSRVNHLGYNVWCRDYCGCGTARFAGDRGPVVRPRFQNPEKSGISTGGARGSEFLTIKGNTVYYPGTKITGNVRVIRKIELPFISDKTPPDFDKSANKPFRPRQSESFEVIVDGERGFATKLEGAQRADYSGEDGKSVYTDGTRVNDGATVWHWLESIPAKRQQNGDIQITEGILPIQFERQNKYLARTRNTKFMAKIDTDDFQIGKVLNTYILKDLERSAEVMATLLGVAQTQAYSVYGLFGQLYTGTIDEDCCYVGLKQIIKETMERDGATVKDAQKISTEIKRASAFYVEKKALQEQQNGQKRSTFLHRTFTGCRQAIADKVQF